MTQRELAISKAVLDYLHSLDGGQATPVLIHASPPVGCVTPRCSALELDAALEHCDAQRWVSSVPSRFSNVNWYRLTPLGESVRWDLGAELSSA